MNNGSLHLAVTALLSLAACSAPAPSPSPVPLPPQEPVAAATPSVRPQGQKDLPPSAFNVTWGSFQVPARLKPGEVTVVKVSFKNTSPVAWPGGGTESMPYTVRLSHRWLKQGKEVIAYGDHRVELPPLLQAGEELTLEDTLRAPAKPGRYVLQFDLVHENVSWFETMGADKKTFEVTVR